MLPTDKSQDSWRLALKYIGRCPLCNEDYKQENAELFDKNETSNLVHITCNKCKINFVAAIFLLGQGISTVGALTDLSLDDIKKIHGKEPVTADEVINLHNLLQSGDFFKS